MPLTQHIIHFANLMQMSAMKASFQIAECSLDSAKVRKICLPNKSIMVHN